MRVEEKYMWINAVNLDLKHRGQVPKLVQYVLDEFIIVFKKPKGQPLTRSHDHLIMTKKGIPPINVHVCVCLLIIKKNEIKKL